MLADAMQIADDWALILIRSLCGPCRTRGVQRFHYFDLTRYSPSDSPIRCSMSDAPERDKKLIAGAVRYLESRGLLIRKDGEPHVVSFREPA